jgi:glycosyltransferase involved in cell wall biosynthesis
LSVETTALRTRLPFVVFGDEWASHVTSTHHLARGLARSNPLLYVNAMGTRSPRLRIYDLRRALGKLKQWAAPNNHRSDKGLPNARLYSPVVVPFNSVGFVRRCNRFTLRRGVARLLQAHDLEAPILLVAHPLGAEVVGAIGERLLIYFVMDQYLAMPGIDRAYIQALEETLLQEADLIFATSTELQRLKSGRKAPAILLPHGVDFEHFHSAADPPGPVPEELIGLPRPLIGMYGTLAPWVDVDLLVRVAREFPQASVVLIGPRTHFVLPGNLPNLHWLGPRPYVDLPRYAAHFDVGLIPFRRDELTACVNPLKLLEYLALGLPVVSTLLPDLARYGGHIYVAATPDDFVEKVKLALADHAPARRQQRFDLAARESWDSRVETLLKHIEKALDRRVAA